MSGVEAGVDRIVDQIVNPAAMEAEVESVIYRFRLNIINFKLDNLLLFKVLWDNQGGRGGQGAGSLGQWWRSPHGGRGGGDQASHFEWRGRRAWDYDHRSLILI